MNGSGAVSTLTQGIPKRKSGRTFHSSHCYIVEEVTGRTIYTSWDNEEAFRLADQLLVSGKETRNKLAVRRVSCSLVPPPITENGALVESWHGKVKDSNFSCPENTFPVAGYCVEKLDTPNNVDMGSTVRKRLGDHLIVCVGERGSWDPIREKYHKPPHIYEIWHPRKEKSCTIKVAST